jgi:hypothetical protein
MRGSRFIRVSDLGSLPQRPGRWPIHVNSIWRLIREGKLPKPVKLSPGCAVFPVELIEEIETARLQGSKEAPKAAAGGAQ